jgi:nucleoporin NDC1
MATQTTTQYTNALAAQRPAVTSPVKPMEGTRSYKDFLTAALHHRFRRACYLLLTACYTESLLMRWNWASFTGIRALLLFMPCLAVFILRVANMHVGVQTTASVAESVYKTATSWKTAHTLAWYVYSAWFFGEVYLWSRGDNANLGWVDQGRRYEDGAWERPLLNENPIFLRALWICLAFAQAVLHLERNEDRIRMPEKEAASTNPKAESRYNAPDSLQELGRQAPTILGHVLRLLVPGIALTLPIYLLIIRHIVWPYFYPIARFLLSTLPDHAPPTGLQHHMQLSWQALSSSFTLILLWQLCNAVFTIFVSRPPLRRDQPLTTEVKDAQGNVVNRSRDPNGSLLSGMKSKKEVTKTFAFWELWLICSQYDARRKTIYTEVDRAGGSTWTRISQYCLDEISAIQTRIRDAQAPPPPSQSQQQQSTLPNNSQQLQQQGSLASLPRIADRQVIPNGNVFVNPGKGDFAHRVGDVAKSFGQDPNAAHSVKNRARQAIEWSADRVLSKEEQQRLTRQGLTQEANSTLVKFLRSPPGEPFRQTFARRAMAVVFGTPHSRRVDIVHASQTLSILCVKSLTEDDYGQVARSVPVVIRTHTSAITAISNFLATLQPSWTDVDFSERDRRVREVEELVDVLKASLEGGGARFWRVCRCRWRDEKGA